MKRCVIEKISFDMRRGLNSRWMIHAAGDLDLPMLAHYNSTHFDLYLYRADSVFDVSVVLVRDICMILDVIVRTHIFFLFVSIQTNQVILLMEEILHQLIW